MNLASCGQPLTWLQADRLVARVARLVRAGQTTLTRAIRPMRTYISRAQGGRRAVVVVETILTGRRTIRLRRCPLCPSRTTRFGMPLDLQVPARVLPAISSFA